MNFYQLYVHLHNKIAELSMKSVMNHKQRMKMYRMLEKMTAEPATLQINEAIEELKGLEENKGLKTRLWHIYHNIMEQMRNSDADFAKALSKFVPQQDTMIIVASEQDDITLGFTNVMENNKKASAMKQAFLQALAYPLMMLGILIVLLYYFSVKVIPAFVESLQPGTELSSTSEFLMYMANSFNWWFSMLIGTLIGMVLFTFWAMPNLTSNYRKYLENIAPFNMYRIMVGCGFLFALNSLGKSGYMQYDALEQMVKLAKPYLRYRIHVVMEYMADGLDIGQALIQSKLNFPDKQMLRELAIHIKYSEDDSLAILSETLTEDSLEAIKLQAQLLRFLISFIVFGIIGFLYYAVYQFGIDLSNVKM